MLEIYHEKYPVTYPTGPVLEGEERYVAPQGYSDHYHHVKNWIDAIRSREPVIEDPVFGFRAAGTALLSQRQLRQRQARPLGPGWNEAAVKFFAAHNLERGLWAV